MFLAAFGLTADPFLDTADPAFYHETPAAMQRRQRLSDCLTAGRGLAVVVGPIGAGKTALLNAVASDMIAAGFGRVGLILDPTFATEEELLTAAARALGLNRPSGDSRRDYRESFKRSLFDSAGNRQEQAVLLIDEAQLLDERLLETLRSLLNYALDDRKLLSIALAGQPELSDAILRHRNFADRVALWLELKALTVTEAGELVSHRLRCAGFGGPVSPFEDDAVVALSIKSGGLPRRLTTLAREAMESAAERAAASVSLLDVEVAAQRIAPQDINAAGSDSLSRASGSGALSRASSPKSLGERLRAWWRAAS
ncbi:MAG: AAA family ATPase [Candidatus Eremiobacteraeota bacterium]|nr:AAA family ATPase [Candidatus Eremiobacteraeota bacterium]MBC5826308.1 AAA family ATPase [Candidatus Eremiobacteraeota bacterium]